MPDVSVDHSVLILLEEAAPFDEFQHYGLDPEPEASFWNLEPLDLDEIPE